MYSSVYRTGTKVIVSSDHFGTVWRRKFSLDLEAALDLEDTSSPLDLDVQNTAQFWAATATQQQHQGVPTARLSWIGQ